MEEFSVNNPIIPAIASFMAPIHVPTLENHPTKQIVPSSYQESLR